MSVPKTILVATDFSDAAEAAFDYAIDLVVALNAKLIVLHAYELPVYGFPDGTMVATSEMATSIMTAATQSLATSCARHAKPTFALTQVVREGRASEEVHRVAEEMNAELIVIGTHGRTGVAHALLGSVAEKIVRTATRPVLTVHAVKEKLP